MITCGKFVTGQHTISFHQSRTLANAVPLGFCCGGFSSTAGYAPATKLNFRRAASPPSAGPLPKGTTRFYPSGSGKPRDFLKLSLSAPTQGVIKTSSRLLFLSPSASPHRSPIPLSVSKAVTFVTEALYRTGILASTFSVFYFL